MTATRSYHRKHLYERFVLQYSDIVKSAKIVVRAIWLYVAFGRGRCRFKAVKPYPLLEFVHSSS